MWPPSSRSFLPARSTIATAFQRTIRAQAVLELVVAGRALLEVRRDRVEVRGLARCRAGTRPSGAPCRRAARADSARARGPPLRGRSRARRPTPGFQGISVELAVHWRSPCYVKPRPDGVAESRGMSLCKHETCRASGRPHRHCACRARSPDRDRRLHRALLGREGATRHASTPAYSRRHPRAAGGERAVEGEPVAR